MGCATLRHNARSIAREASAAPAASFKSAYRRTGFETILTSPVSAFARLENYFRVARKITLNGSSRQTGLTDVLSCRSERSGGST